MLQPICPVLETSVFCNLMSRVEDVINIEKMYFRNGNARQP